MSSSMYQHRALGPGGVPPEPPVYNARALAETLDRVKQEFDLLANELSISRDQRERYEATITSQTEELEKIHKAVRDLETQHNKIRQQYDYELRVLRSELQASRQTRPSSALATLSSPSIFMGSSAPAHSPVLDPHHGVVSRERDREARDIQRARFLDQGSNKRIKLDQPESNRLPLIGPGSSPSSRRPPTPPAPAPAPPAPPPAAQPAYMNEFLNNLDLSSIHPEWKKETNEWFAMYNPKVKRTLDINLLHTFSHETVVCCIQFSGDGKYLATGCNRATHLFDVQSGRKICSLSDEGASKKGDLYIRSVRFSPDGRFLATGAEDERIRVWDVEKRNIRVVFEGHHQDIYALEFSPDGRRLVSGSGDATVRIWDMENPGHAPVCLAAQAEAGSAGAGAAAGDDDAGVMAVALSPDGAYIAAGCVDAIVRVWSMSSCQLIDVLRGHSNSVHSVAFTKDGGGIISGALDNTVRCWDLRARKGTKEGVPCVVFAGHKDYVLSVGVSRDSQWIVSGSKDRGVHFWDSNGVVQCLLQGHKNSVISTSLHPVANLLATGSGDKLARIWSYTPS